MIINGTRTIYIHFQDLDGVKFCREIPIGCVRRTLWKNTLITLYYAQFELFPHFNFANNLCCEVVIENTDIFFNQYQCNFILFANRHLYKLHHIIVIYKHLYVHHMKRIYCDFFLQFTYTTVHTMYWDKEISRKLLICCIETCEANKFFSNAELNDLSQSGSKKLVLEVCFRLKVVAQTDLFENVIRIQYTRTCMWTFLFVFHLVVYMCGWVLELFVYKCRARLHTQL